MNINHRALLSVAAAFLRDASIHMRDLESRLATRVQITTDGFRPYVNAVDDA
jgi:hypothetical protein